MEKSKAAQMLDNMFSKEQVIEVVSLQLIANSHIRTSRSLVRRIR